MKSLGELKRQAFHTCLCVLMSPLINDRRWSPFTKAVVHACFQVHRQLGPGLLESVYDDALSMELSDQGVSYSRQHPVFVSYNGRKVGDPFRIDFFVEDCVVVEIKAVEQIHPVHEAQILTYLKLTKAPVGLLINFHSPLLGQGIHRYLNTPQ